jgi:hypothetical protein
MMSKIRISQMLGKLLWETVGKLPCNAGKNISLSELEEKEGETGLNPLRQGTHRDRAQERPSDRIFYD